MAFDLDQATESFAQDVQDLLDQVLRRPEPEDAEKQRLKVLPLGKRRVIRPGTEDTPAGIPVYSEDKHVANLELIFHCEPDQENTFLAVRKSMFQLASTQEGTPLLRLDYVHGAHSIPAAHWNIHAERGATSVLLARCNPRHEGRLSQIHLPVGGVRHRPCLEDFLEMTIAEFNIDKLPQWKDAVRTGRERWRTLQTRAIVRDSPEVAAEVLRRMGYEVTTPHSGPPPQNLEILQAR